MAQATESIEAVVISGPRRGEIIRLSDAALTEVSHEDITVLNEALDRFVAAVDRVSREVRTTTEVLRKSGQAV